MSRFLGRHDSRDKHRLPAIWAPAFSNWGQHGSTETLWLWHGQAHTEASPHHPSRVSDISIKFDVMQRTRATNCAKGCCQSSQSSLSKSRHTRMMNTQSCAKQVDRRRRAEEQVFLS